VRQKLGEYIFQALIIIFSVLFALFLNEYRGNQKAERELDKIVFNIKSEVAGNSEVLKEVIPYHNNILLKLNSVIANPDYLKSIMTPAGVNLREIVKNDILQKIVVKAAWDTAKLNGSMSGIETDKLMLMAKVYNQLELTFQPVYAIVEMIYSREFLQQEKALENLLIIRGQLCELAGREQSLQRFYNELQQALEKS